MVRLNRAMVPGSEGKKKKSSFKDILSIYGSQIAVFCLFIFTFDLII